MSKTPFTSRRAVLAFAAAAALVPFHASAQAGWPNRPIKLIVPYAAGGGTDVIARTIATKLAARLGQPVVIENRGGAGGAIGFEAGVKAPADGYTLLFVTSAYATNAAGAKKPYDPVKDIAPIALVGSTPLLIAVPANSPVKTLRDLVEMARAKPEAVTYGSGGVGAMSHLGMELLASEAKVKFVHVPYKGMAPAFADMIGGNLQAGLTTFATTSGLIAGGKLRGIVVTGKQRTPFAPDLPTTAEAGFPGVQIDFWWGIVGPAALPTPIVKRLNEEINALLNQPETKEALGREAATPAPGKPEEFGRLVASDIARWTRLIKDNNIKVE